MKPKKASSKKLSPAAKALLAGVGVIAFAALGYFLLIGPKRSEASSLDAEIAAKRTQLADLMVKAQQVPPAPIEIPDLFRLAKAMPDTTDMSGILLELSRVASEAGIEFESISPGPPAAVGTYQVVPVSVMFQGNFYTLSDFLFRLRNLVQVNDGELSANGRLFSVDAVSFAQGKKQFPEIQATLTVNAFVFGSGATPAPAAPPPATTTTTTTAPATTEPSPSEPPALPTAAATPGG